jgi:hypothetical protein
MMGHYYLADKGWESVWGCGPPHPRQPGLRLLA